MSVTFGKELFKTRARLIYQQLEFAKNYKLQGIPYNTESISILTNYSNEIEQCELRLARLKNKWSLNPSPKWDNHS